MTTSTMIHYVESVRAGGVSYTNDNAVMLEITCANTKLSLTLFGLSTADAEHLSRSLSRGASALSEDDIRADERAKIAARLGL